ncbi:MAG: response regulator transcription factor [Burkholderiaceae bacterium]|nr:response regulator transcription factor [Microbacteriaceae bacterium]
MNAARPTDVAAEAPGAAEPGTADAAIRVLLVDDQHLVRAGFRIILGSEPGIEVVGEATTGREAVQLALDRAPDVICMDVQMPGMDGLEATRLISADTRITSRVLVLTTFDRDDYLFAALRAGASGFLLKNSSPESLIEAVRVVARGDALLSPEVTRRVLERFSTPGEQDLGADAAASSAAAETAALLERLSGREREVLEHLAQGASNAEIATTLFVGEATVKTHVSNVLMKLAVRDRIEAVVWAYEHGVVLPGNRD